MIEGKSEKQKLCHTNPSIDKNENQEIVLLYRKYPGRCYVEAEPEICRS